MANAVEGGWGACMAARLVEQVVVALRVTAQQTHVWNSLSHPFCIPLTTFVRFSGA